MVGNIQLPRSRVEKGRGGTADPSAAIEASGHVMASVIDMGQRLFVCQTALVMAVEGKARASATEIANRVEEEHPTMVTASVVGIILAGYGVRSVRSGGRSRLVLDAGQLQQIVQRIEKEAEAIGPEVERAVNRFGNVVDVVEQLDARVGRVRFLARRQQEMKEYLDKHRLAISGLYHLERQYQQAQGQVQRVAQLQGAIKSLGEQVKGLPDTETRRQELEQSIADHAARIKDLDRREKGLAAQQSQLESRTQQLSGRERRQAQENAAVDLAELEAIIAGRQKELDDEVKTREREIRDLDKQINSKRSLLDRVLGRDGEGP